MPPEANADPIDHGYEWRSATILTSAALKIGAFGLLLMAGPAVVAQGGALLKADQDYYDKMIAATHAAMSALRDERAPKRRKPR